MKTERDGCFNIHIKVNSIFVLILLCSAVMVSDSAMVGIYLNIPREPPASITAVIFAAFVIFFVLSNYFLIKFSKQGTKVIGQRPDRPFRLLHWVILPIQITLCIILTSLLIQVLTSSSYNLVFVSSVVYLSHLSCIGYLILLTYQFFLWLRSYRNYLIILYASAFSILILNVVTSLIFLGLDLSFYDQNIKKMAIKRFIGVSSNPTIKLSFISTFYDYISIIAFVGIWITTSILLKSYTMRFGKIRYWTIVSIPLIFFIFPFLANEFGIFDNLRFEYGKFFNLIYYVFFSPYKQVGGMLFGVAFWIAATRTRRKNLRLLLQTTGVGIVLVFGSLVIHGLAYITFPPFGVITIAFMGLGAYMLLIGIYGSSRELARDAEIRREIYHVAAEQSDLLKHIGMAEIERLLEKRVKSVIDKADTLGGYDTEINTEQEDVKDMIYEVLNELKKIEQDKKK